MNRGGINLVKKENKNRVSLVLSDYLYEYVEAESELLGMPINSFIAGAINDYKMGELAKRRQKALLLNCARYMENKRN